MTNFARAAECQIAGRMEANREGGRQILAKLLQDLQVEIGPLSPQV